MLARIHGRDTDHLTGQAESMSRMLRDPRVWLLGIFNLCMLGSSYAYSFSAPTIVQTLLGLNITDTGFVISAMYLIAGAAMFGNGILADRARDTFWYVIPGCFMMTAGFLTVALASNPGVALTGLLVLIVGPYWMGIAKDLTGNYRRGLLTMAVPMLLGAGIMLYLRWQAHQPAPRFVGSDADADADA